MITKVNEDFIKELHPKVSFTESSTNTSTFECTVTTFEKIRNKIREKGLNPYAVLYW